jgi:hypothetical protein
LLFLLEGESAEAPSSDNGNNVACGWHPSIKESWNTHEVAMKSITYLLVLAALAAAGCTTSRGKFTRENYETLYYGQSAPEVQQAIGKPALQEIDRRNADIEKYAKDTENPTREELDRWEYHHEAPYYKAVIFLHNGQVVGWEWYDDPLATQPTSAPTGKKSVPAKSGTDHKPKKEKKKPRPPEDQEPADAGS